jgi:hypothetical protein
MHKLRLPLINWIQREKDDAEIKLQIERNQDLDNYAGKKAPLKKPFNVLLEFTESQQYFEVGELTERQSGTNPDEYIWSGKGAGFPQLLDRLDASLEAKEWLKFITLTREQQHTFCFW